MELDIKIQPCTLKTTFFWDNIDIYHFEPHGKHLSDDKKLTTCHEMVLRQLNSHMQKK